MTTPQSTPVAARPEAGLVSDQGNTTPANTTSPLSPASETPGQPVSTKVAQLRMRREGSRVYATLECEQCDHTGQVEINVGTAHSASIDPPSGDVVTCDLCGGEGYVELESTQTQPVAFVAYWAAHLYGFTEVESSEANRRLCELEDQATEFAWKARRTA